jgi:hypothetical protein
LILGNQVLGFFVLEKLSCIGREKFEIGRHSGTTESRNYSFGEYEIERAEEEREEKITKAARTKVIGEPNFHVKPKP